MFTGRLANPWNGWRTRDLQEQLYRHTAAALVALNDDDTSRLSYLVRCCADITAILRPGYFLDEEDSE